MKIFKPDSILDSFIDSWRNRGKLGSSSRSRDELAFLPAALEILETPPHPLAHAISRTLIAFVVIAILWACFGKVNIVATAEGKIIPGSRLKQIQPLEKGVVTVIHVKEGDKVVEGQPLIELDATLTGADQQNLTNELTQAQMNLERLQAFQARLVGAPLVGARENQSVGAPLQEQLLEQQWQQYIAQRASAEGELAKRRAEQASNIEQIRKLEGTLPLITKRAAAIKSLMEKKMASEAEYLTIEEQRIAQQQDLATYRANAQQLNAAVTQAEQQLKALVAQVQGDTLGQISETQRQVSSLQEQLNKATDLNARQILYAPVSGRVQGLAVNTVGGVVTEAQQLMMIVPEGENLEVEVWLENKDIGFVQEGDAAEIKVHTFPFTKYGVIDAKVTRISNDAFSTEQTQKDPSQNAGLVYTMGLTMANNTMMVNGRSVPLMPGMAVTAEVKTGERRMIEFFLAPLLKAKKESIRER